MEASISTPWAVVPVAASAVGAYELITSADSPTGEPPGDPSKDSTEDSARDMRELVNLEPTQWDPSDGDKQDQITTAQTDADKFAT